MHNDAHVMMLCDVRGELSSGTLGAAAEPSLNESSPHFGAH